MLTFDHPDYFRRHIPSGPIPSPVLLTETVRGADLKRGDIIVNAHPERNESAGLFAEVISDPGTNGRRITRYVGDQSSGLVAATDTVRVVREITFGLLTQGIAPEWLRDDSIRYYGKFDDQCSAYCYEVSLDADDRAGDMDMGWYAARVDLHMVNGTVYPLRSDPVLAQWPEIAGTYPAGYIVTENDRGFVNVSFFDTVEELEIEWSKLRDAESAYYADEDEDTEIGADLAQVMNDTRRIGTDPETEV